MSITQNPVRCDCRITRNELLSLQEKGPLLLPGDFGPGKILIFPDPFFAFYEQIFPHLVELKIRALVGISPRYIVPQTSCQKEERLRIPSALAFQEGFFEEKAPFCTWDEIREMVLTGYVEVACHSYSKMNLTFSFVNLQREVIEAKKLLEAKIPQAVSSFIFPFGKKNSTVSSLVSSHYLYSFC